MNKILGSALSVMIAFMISGCSMMSMGKTYMGLEPETQDVYAKMMDKVDKYGDPARAMMLEWEVDEDVSNEDVAESVAALAEEYNMSLTSDVRMYTKDDAADDEVRHARIFSMCNLTTAKIFMNYSRWYSGFMPCRIVLVEYGSGTRYLITMDMDMAIYGGDPLPDEMHAAAVKVKEALEMIPERAAQGDF